MSRKTGRSKRPLAAEAGSRPAGTRSGSAASAKAARARTAPGRAQWRFRLLGRVVLAVAMAVLFYSTAVGHWRQITWYLAVDQFGYLTFAHDLLRGRVFHEWGPLPALEPFFPARTDVLAQTYVYDEGKLYCRYSPGFPILLAGWIGVFGDDWAHYLNPTLYLVLLAVAFAFQWRLFRSPWRAGAGTALIALAPTMMHLWGLTLTRDLSAHLFGLTGLLLLLPARGRALGAGRLAAAGLALGFTVAIRPDGVLYLVPAACLLGLRLWQERRRRDSASPVAAAAGLALGLVAGASPILAYNWAATGNPLIPTQGMELPLLPQRPPPKPKVQQRTSASQPATPPVQTRPEAEVGFPSPGWRGGTIEQVQGGGLRLKHLATTLPGNWRLMLRAYTPMLFAVAVWGAIVASVTRPLLAVAAVSYGVTAFLFFSCWPRPDFRYLIGVFVFLPMLVVEGALGTLDLVRLVWRRRREEVARGLAACAAGLFLLGAYLWSPPAQSGHLPLAVFLVVVLTTGGAAALAAALPSRRVVAIAAPLMMLGLVWCKADEVRAQAARRAPFQGPQMREARGNMQRLLEPGAVVITSEDVGRPAENIEYYTGRAHALYFTDLERWRLPVFDATLHLLLKRMRPYLFVAANHRDKAAMLDDLRTRGLTVDLVADIPANRSMAHFVAAPFHRGVRMELYRVSQPAIEAAGARAQEGAGTPPAATP